METETAVDAQNSTNMEIIASNLISSSSSHTEMIFSSLSHPDQVTAVTVSSCSGFSFSTHKLLLAAASPFLRQLLLADTKSDSISLLLPDFSCPALHLLEQFLRTGEISCLSNCDHTSCHQLLDTLQLLPKYHKLGESLAPDKLESLANFKKGGNMKENVHTFKKDSGECLNNEVEEENLNDSQHCCIRPPTMKQTRNVKLSQTIYAESAEDSVKLPCPSCGKIFTKGVRFDIHLRKHQGNKPYVCEVCDKEFDNKSTYFNHKKNHVNESQKSVCDVCGGNYKDAHTLKVHAQTQHLMVDKPFSCEVCGDKFKTRGSLKIHSSKHEEDRAFVCDECGFQTKNKWLLKAHLKTHKIVKDFQCPHCPKTFNFQFILDKHIRIHTNERPFPCETCGTSFVSGIHLRRHQKSVHKTVRDFVCNICSAPFKRLSEIKRHIILHTSERPFECKVCGETFKHREAGRRHSKVAHPGSSGSITFKPTETIGQLNTFAIKKLSPDEVGKANNPSTPQLYVNKDQFSQLKNCQTGLLEETRDRHGNHELNKKEFLDKFVQNHPNRASSFNL